MQLDPHEVWKGYNTSKNYAAFVTKTLVNKDGVYSAPNHGHVFKLSQRQAQAKTPFLDNLIQMLTFDIGLSILHCSFAASKSLACFCSPYLQNDRAATVPAAP
uniref:Helix-turn-helix domain-containing protein n=1 Tax=Escherichia coli TaxID=562 RepID=A0A3G4RXN1_ECOLX|nr:helix-turn-helix domain-containing protein [Escherichia coli]